MTKNFIRLVPASQSRAGWLWNEYSIESDDFEVEVVMRVASKPHFGGDGFGIWILASDLDPQYHDEPDYLNGGLFGLREDFKGFGVVFDTYDNDGKRDNPSIFSIENFEGSFPNDHNADFDNVMTKTVDHSAMAHRCFSSYRNTKDPFKVLLRYASKVLHVYISDGSFTSTKSGYKYCLSVRTQFPSTMKEKHLALTALTGQVADKVEILEISTRYLTAKDKLIDDRMMEWASGSATSRFAQLFWLIIFGAGLVLLYLTIKDIGLVSQLANAQTNPVYLCNELNPMVLPHIGLHFIVSALLLLSGNFFGFLLNLPVVAYRVFSIATNTYKLDPAILSGGGRLRGKRPLISYQVQLYLYLAFYIVCSTYYFSRLISA